LTAAKASTKAITERSVSNPVNHDYFMLSRFKGARAFTEVYLSPLPRDASGSATMRILRFTPQALSRTLFQEIPMTISMYQASVPRFVNILGNLSGILDKAIAHTEARKIDPSVLPSFRIAPDMLPMSAQVQIACDGAKGLVARLSGVTAPVFEDNEKTLGELKQRIAKTIAFIQSVPADAIDGTEDKDIVIKRGEKETHYKGLQFLLGYAVPNFYFHVTTAYAILRHNGVEIGKRDFLGNP
jgi:hypothetical protein